MAPPKGDGSARRVVVLGASRRPESYSNRAVRRLLEKGFEVIPVHPRYEDVEGIPAFRSLDEIRAPVDTLTVYVGPRNLEPLIEDIVKLRPGRVVLNPGTESPALEARLQAAGIPYVEDCTLVMLAGGGF
jgi:predicted CoA-binding protein